MQDVSLDKNVSTEKQKKNSAGIHWSLYYESESKRDFGHIFGRVCL